MRIGIVGAGHIGGNAARMLARGGHAVKLSFSRDRARLEGLARDIGGSVSVGAPKEAVAFGEVVMLSVPWAVVPEALRQAGPLTGKVVIDTTNRFGPGPGPAAGETAAEFNSRRMPEARYVKAFNTLTAGFQAEAAGRQGDRRVALFLCGDDAGAKQVVSRLIDDSGFHPIDLGGTKDAAVMESPRRPGAVYGEEYRLPDARAVTEAVRAGLAIPPVPVYEGEGS